MQNKKVKHVGTCYQLLLLLAFVVFEATLILVWIIMEPIEVDYRGYKDPYRYEQVCDLESN
jgi:hypothetical protein